MTMRELPSWAKSMSKLQLANAWTGACEECDKLTKQVEQLRNVNAALLTACEHAEIIISITSHGGLFQFEQQEMVLAMLRSAIAKMEGKE